MNSSFITSWPGLITNCILPLHAMLAVQCYCLSSLGAIFWYVSVIVACHCDIHWIYKVLSYQPQVTVTSCFVYKAIRDL